MTDAAGCEPHRPSSRHWRRRLVQVLQQQYMFHRKCIYSLPVYQEFASLRPPLGGRTRLVYLFIYASVQQISHAGRSTVNVARVELQSNGSRIEGDS